MQKAIDSLGPGQTALFRAGSYGRGRCEGSADSGSDSGYVTLKAYPGERATLSAGTDGVLYLSCSYVRIEGLVIQGPGAVGGTLVYGVSGSHHVELVGNEVTGSVCQGVYTDEETSSYQVLRNWIHHNGQSACDRQAHGIYVQGDNHLIANNLIHDHPEGFGIQHYDYGRNVRIVNNTITYAAHGGIVVGGGGSGPSGSRVAGAVVVNNILAYNGTYGIDSDSTAPTSCEIHHNLAYANGRAPYDTGFPSGCLGSNRDRRPPLRRSHRSQPGRCIRQPGGERWRQRDSPSNPPTTVPRARSVPRPTSVPTSGSQFSVARSARRSGRSSRLPCRTWKAGDTRAREWARAARSAGSHTNDWTLRGRFVS